MGAFKTEYAVSPRRTWTNFVDLIEPVTRPEVSNEERRITARLINTKRRITGGTEKTMFRFRAKSYRFFPSECYLQY
jgi:hypothetical protein